jgi:carboxyl-terminal processing protease
MLKRWISLTGLSIAILALVFCSNKPFSGDEPLLKRLMITLNGQHYAPQKMDDSFSLKAFENAFENLDGNKQFFTEVDYSKMLPYQKQIDDQINSGRFDFFDSLWNTMMFRLNQIEPWIYEMVDTTIDHNQGGTFEVSKKNKTYAKNDASLKKYWQDWARYQVLDRLYRKQKQQNDWMAKGDTSVKIAPFDTLEFKARSETKSFVQTWFKRWRKMDRQDQLAFYANTIAEIYDPHTNYFPPADKENFEISMTGKLEGIGATLSERDGYIKVERIVPGSASYKQGELKAGDLILKVGQGKEDPVDVVDMKLDDAIQLIRGKKGTEVRLTVKKPDGVIKVIPIIREVVVIEETYARSAIVLQGKKRYGFIQLPSFYADFSTRGRGRNSAGDVRLEVEKLKEERVDGIILDLRNNGGGSLADAIEMTGLFFPSGPVVQVKDSEGNINAANDFNPSTLYSGPLVVLTNAYSASASEILAAALQDYKRAVIIGSKHTFGKGTVQTMVELKGGSTQTFPRGFGELKVTIQKFYRINGGTTQLRGVEPDVIVPDVYDAIERGEKEMTYHLNYDEIPAARYKTMETKMYKEAIKSGQKLVKSQSYFNAVVERSKYIEKMRDGSVYSLNLAAYAKEQDAIEKADELFKKNSYKTKYDTLISLPRDLSEVAGDSIKLAQRTSWPKTYMKDPVLDIAIEVLRCWSN